MSEPACLYTVLHAGRERLDEILRDLVTPAARAVASHPDLDSLFFVRYDEPDWQVRFRILGKSAWIEGPVREMVDRLLAPLLASGLVERHEFGAYDREWPRYGGPEGMALAEKLFLVDSLACLELLEAERGGRLKKTRREISMMITERFLDLARFDARRRIDFYGLGCSWAVASWKDEDLATLDRKYQALRPGLANLFGAAAEGDPVALYGSEEAARIAGRLLEGSRPVVEEILAAHAAGRVRQDIVYLVWSYAHMHCNRLGIEPAPEAILRYFMHRLHSETAG
ncbi:MAG: hypothetical protein HY049_07770 [Acidobacteria bacterium]|nr:hypothetical protein [Acidobacteriota bacterium]